MVWINPMLLINNGLCHPVKLNHNWAYEPTIMNHHNNLTPEDLLYSNSSNEVSKYIPPTISHLKLILQQYRNYVLIPFTKRI